jgi:hypothetical protein
MQLLIFNLDACARTAVFSQHLCTILLLILCSFSTLRFWGFHNFVSIPDALCYLVFPGGAGIFGIWILLIQALPARLKESSEEFRVAWARTTYTLGEDERKIRNRVLLSCRNLNVPVGNFFYYRTSTMPNVMNVIVDQTVSLLIAAD